MKRIILLLLIVLALVPTVIAKENHIKILAVSEIQDGGYRGASADLTVEIQPGTGRVFIDTFPLSKLDTQISTRFAKEIACEYSSQDCTQLDFFYTIRSTSAIIAGPSAGASLGVITLATLENFPVNGNVAITGTINSGGLIGPVSGIKEKIDAAKEVGLSTVLIPLGEAETVGRNGSINHIAYGEEIGIRVIEVIDLDEAMFYISGTPMREPDTSFEVDKDYTDTMLELARDLCVRSDSLGVISFNESNLLFASARNLSQRGALNFEDGQYYAAASFCFGANVRYNQGQLQEQNLSVQEIATAIELGLLQIRDRRSSLPAYKTIRDLEAFALVTERLDESERTLIQARELVKSNQSAASVRQLAFAQERILSADSWSRFFGSGGKPITISDEQLMNSCTIKLAEAEERFQYVALFIENILTDTRRELNSAYSDSREKKYDSCLFKASRAKAEADSVLTVIGTTPAQIDKIIGHKEKAARLAISRQAKQGTFPIAGYSYFEYAQSLRDFDQASALLFYEYALELSDLDIYFENGVSPKSRYNTARVFEFARDLLLIASGIVIGSSGVLLLRRFSQKKNHKESRFHKSKKKTRTKSSRR